jgi:type IV secretory pathway TraG/TraD family ATPase VirD4
MVQALATAHWADPHWVEERYPSIEGTVWLGRSASERDLPLGYRDDRHVTLVSGNRGGKGTSSIINNLCLWPGSVVVVDPKGENATVTAGRRGNGTPYVDGLGQAVHVLDPFAVAKIPDFSKWAFAAWGVVNCRSRLS